MVAIDVKKLSKFYREHPAVNNITFQVKQGVIFGLLGPNGAGKSTTIKMLTTLLPPTSGQALIFGHDIVKEADLVRQKIGYVPQSISADGELTAYENLLFSGKLYDLDRKKLQKRIDEVLEFMSLSAFKYQLVNQFSGGMIRRLEIALAMLHEPKVLFLDEPTVGLDPSAKATLWKYILDWKDMHNITVILTTHDMEEADKLCDEIAFMFLGNIVAIDTPKNFKHLLGKDATLNDVFIHHTGESLNAKGDMEQVKQQRRTISNLD